MVLYMILEKSSEKFRPTSMPYEEPGGPAMDNKVEQPFQLPVSVPDLVGHTLACQVSTETARPVS